MFYLEGWGRKELIRRIEIQKRMKESIPSIFPSLVIFIFLFSNLNELIHILLLYYSSNNWLNELFFNSSTLLSMHPSSYPYIDVLIIYILLEDMYLFLEQSLKGDEALLFFGDIQLIAIRFTSDVEFKVAINYPIFESWWWHQWFCSDTYKSWS